MTDKRICTTCRNELRPGARFCSSCGGRGRQTRRLPVVLSLLLLFCGPTCVPLWHATEWSHARRARDTFPEVSILQSPITESLRASSAYGPPPVAARQFWVGEN